MERIWREMQLRREDLLMYGGVIFFLLFILYNVKVACDRGALWLPSKYLVLSGLILQLAAEAEVKNVSISGPHQQEEVEKLMGRQLSIDSARLTLCVFVGYLLPGMGTTAYKGVWTTIAALLISLVTHISMECFIAVQLYVKGNGIRVSNQSWVWFILSEGLLSLLLISFFIGMVYAILIAKFYRDNLSERIKAIIDHNVEMNWAKLKEEVLKSWILARVCQPDYISARTAYSAGVGVAVTVCVAFFGIKVVWLRSLLNKRLGLFLFQSVFILVGWFVILYRWLGPVYYFVVFREKQINKADLKSELRAFKGMVNTPVSHVLRSLLSITVDAKMLKFVLPVLLLPLLLWQIIVTEIVMYLTVKCWVISWWVFDNKVIRSLAKADTKLAKLKKKSKESEDFYKYKEALESLRTPAEDVAGLWIANESCFASVKQGMETAYEEGRGKCKELIELIRSCVEENNNIGRFAGLLVEPLPGVKKYFPGLKEPLWSMSAVSLLDIIIRVGAGDKVVKAFEQAYPLMDLADCPDNIDITVDNFGSSNLQSFLISQASSDGKAKAMKLYNDFGSSISQSFLIIQASSDGKPKVMKLNEQKEQVALEHAKGIIQEKLAPAESILKKNQLLEDSGAGAIGVEWLSVAPNYADYKVCKLILADSDSYRSVEDLRKKLLDSLKDVISSCVLNLPDLLFKKITYWAAELEEQNICKAAQIVAKAQGVIDAATGTPKSTSSEHQFIQA